MPSYNGPVPYFQYAISQAARIIKPARSVENADGARDVFTLSVTDFDFSNIWATATVNGDTFNSVSTLAGCGVYEKVFTVSNVAGVVTFTFKYPPMQVVNPAPSATPNGFKEALVANTNAPVVLTPLPLRVSYGATA